MHIVRFTQDPVRLRDALAVRHAVFVKEQHCSVEGEHDALDATCMHWVMYDGHTPIATARSYASEGVQKIGRVAILPAYRGMGLGYQLMEAVEAWCMEQGCTTLRMHAQTQVVTFYTRCVFGGKGWNVVDEAVFYEENIPHVVMEKCF